MPPMTTTGDISYRLSEFYNALGVKRQVDAAWPRTSTGGAQ